MSDISVIICAYTEKRWNDLAAAVESVQTQTLPPAEIIVVVDHNQQLLERVQGLNVIAIENTGVRGLSGARNSGIAAARSNIIAFLDDDAVAVPDWLMSLCEGFSDPQVLGVGGEVLPLWVSRQASWFPEEFRWVVGCTYRGMPAKAGMIRNPIGANMSFKREVFEAVGGFQSEIGRVGAHPLGCEETELCIRARQYWPSRGFLYQPQAKVFHRVPSDRTSWRYFCSRCYFEGISKALISRYVGTKDGLASERTYTLRVLPRGVGRGLIDAFFRHDSSGLGRAGAIICGLALTAAGYLRGNILLRRAKPASMVLSEHIILARTSDPRPFRVVEVELGRPLPALSAVDERTGHYYQRARCLVRLHHYPLGIVDIQFQTKELDAQDYARHIWRSLHTQIIEHLRQDGLPEVTELTPTGLTSLQTPLCIEECEAFLATTPFMSIIVSTHDRPERLSKSLPALLAQHYPRYEVIIVDNAPSTSATADLIKKTYGDVAKLHYVREDCPGLSMGLNRGVMEATGELLAFTDDDVIVDSYWLLQLARAITLADDVACVTGLVMPLELETPPQIFFEEYGGFNKGFHRHMYDMGKNRPREPLFPYTAGRFGTGASMAFRAAFLREVGGFDPALKCGMDIAVFFQVIKRGYKLVYEPSALVYHAHRRTHAELRNQIYDYGVALTAYLTKTILEQPRYLFELATKVPSGLIFTLSPRSSKNQKKSADYPRDLTRLEIKGMLHGPLAYLHKRRELTRRELHPPAHAGQD